MTVDERESEIGALLEAARLLEPTATDQAAELHRRVAELESLRGQGDHGAPWEHRAAA